MLRWPAIRNLQDGISRLRPVDRAALAEIMREEGKRTENGLHIPYKCSEGYWTAGYGRNLQTARFTEAEVQRWVREDYENAVRQAETIPEYADLSKNRKRVIAQMVFQMGLSGVNKFINMRRYLRLKDYEGAAIEMLKSKWAEQTPARARRMAVRMRLDTWPSG